MTRMVVLAVLAGSAAAVYSQTGKAPQIDLARIDELAADSLKHWGAPGCAIAVLHKGNVVWSKGYGVRAAGASDPVTPRTVFAIGSTTKAFTTAAMGILVDEGKMQWDDPVALHLPRFRLSDSLANELVTVRDLVTHRTGLSRNDLLWYGSPWTRDEILERVRHVRFTKPFRSAWQYQNLMYLAAGQAVASASGMSWEEFLTLRVLTPLAMKNTSFTPAEAERNPDHATPHTNKDGQLKTVKWRNLDNIGPAGSINSNVEDLAQWVKLQMDGGKPLLKPATLREMHTPQMAMRPDDWGRNVTGETNQMSYGLAWFLQDYRGHHVVSHGGAIDGFRAQITLLPNDHYGIIVLANLGDANMPEALRWKIADLLLGLSTKDWDAFLTAREKAAEERANAARAQRLADRVPDTRPSLALDQYAGEYKQPAYGAAKISSANGKLRLEWSGFKATLEHYHYDTFLIPTGEMEGFVQFRVNSRGMPGEVEMLGQTFARAASTGGTR